jgi:hypothetical protein
VGNVSHLNSFMQWAADHLTGLTYVGPDPHHGLGLEAVVPGYAAVGNRSPILAVLAERGIRVMDLDVDGAGDALALLALPEVLRFIAQGGPRVPLFVFKSSDRLEAHARAAGLNLLSSRAARARRWENKVAFADRAVSLGLRVPDWRIVSGAREVEQARRELGGDVVIQAPHGYAGARTLRATDSRQVAEATRQLRSPRLRVGPTISGEPWTLNACVTGRGVAASAPTYQLTGVPSLTRRALGACGNDGTLRSTAAPDMLEAARTLGAALAADGFAGLFGVDFVVEPTGAAWLLEVNPRLVSSIGLATQLEVAAGRLPLLARHFMALVDPQADDAPLDIAADAGLGGSQIVLHNLEDGPMMVTGKVACGAWRPGRDPLLSARPAPRPPLGDAVPPRRASPRRHIESAVRPDLLSSLEDGEWLLIASGRGRIRAPGAEVARLQRRGAVTDPGGGMLRDAVDAAQEVYAALALAPAD